jgi:hypothetical protein
LKIYVGAGVGPGPCLNSRACEGCDVIRLSGQGIKDHGAGTMLYSKTLMRKRRVVHNARIVLSWPNKRG